MTSISYFPVVEEETQLVDLLSRAAWFLSFCALDRIFVPIASAELASMPWRVADSMDPAIEGKFEALQKLVQFVVVREEGDLHRCMAQSSMILRWKKDAIPAYVLPATLTRWEEGKKVLQVDPVAIRQEGSFYIDVSFGLIKNRKEFIEVNQRKFQHLAKKLGRFDRAYVMATGPSIGQYRKFDYSKSISIVCNSVINDEELMAVVKPQILVFADPIFHFGPSQYAATFRAKLAESASRHDYAICIPLKYHALFIAAMPQLADRTIALPFFKDREFNFDLQHEFMLKTTANILTFLMIPLASSFADEVGILGCDGRPLAENTYFWGHNQNTQFSDKMANIREVHPGFFDIDYNDYYLEHCQTLEKQLSDGESLGKQFLSLSFSHIPALSQRTARGRRLSGLLPLDRANSLVVVDLLADGTDESAWSYIERLVDACSSVVEKVTVICRADVESSIKVSTNVRIVTIPPIRGVTEIPDWPASPVALDDDFSLVINEVCAEGLDVLFYLPQASLVEAQAIATVVSHYPNARLHFDLVMPADLNGALEHSGRREFFAWLPDAEPRIVSTLPDNASRMQMAELTGCVYRLAERPGEKGGDQAWREHAISLLGSSSADVAADDAYPRLLVIDLTNMGGLAATSRIKDAFFGTWPSLKFRLICQEGGKNKRLILAGKNGVNLLPSAANTSQIFDAVKDYRAEVIYYRAVDDQLVHDFAYQIFSWCTVPVVLHLMDDWPARLQATKPELFPEFDRTLREMLKSASKCLSIGDSMSAAFRERYGQEFLAFANGIDPATFPPRNWRDVSLQPFTIRYTGALARDMTFDSICDIAEAIENLSKEIGICLEIYTRPPWFDQAKKRFADFQSVSVHDQVPSAEYNDLLRDADALLIAYNFDEESQNYIGYSMANKLPEYLASGVPVIAYGPPDCGTISYIRSKACAHVIDHKDTSLIQNEIRALVDSKNLQMRLGQAGRNVAFRFHNVWKIQNDFHQTLIRAAMEKLSDPILIGPFARRDSAHWDETNGIAEVFESELSGSVMIDVGAHHGTALAPFLNKGWTIFAFEPDEKNRAKLLERLAKHKNKSLVSLDTRCVSNKSQKGVSFYTSEQSTGISGLSAFHESHVEAQRVDTVTLTEFFQDKPLPPVDFLKIDTEGHDLFVLQGFPWDRGLPAVIECEFEDTKTVPLGYTFHDLARFLVDKGYTVYVSEWHPIIRYGIRHDWNRLVRYPSDLADEKGWGNLLAFREPIDENDLVAAVRKVLKVGAGEPTAQQGGRAKNALLAVADGETAKPAALPVKPIAPVVPAMSAKPAAIASAQTGVQAFKVEPVSHFTQLSANQWRYTHSDAPQKLWLAVFDGMGTTDGRCFVAGIRLKSSRAMTVDVSIGRYGSTDYEGSKIRITLAPGSAQSVQVRKEFAKPHTALKVQVEVLELEGGGTADLTIESIYLNETLASIRRRVAGHEVNLRVANRLFRDGDYSAAMGLYLLLHQQRPLKMYPDNALMAARKLGMHSVRTVDDLLQRVS